MKVFEQGLNDIMWLKYVREGTDPEFSGVKYG